MPLREKIGFLGCGNMGRGILSGLIRRKIAKPQNVLVYDVASQKQKALEREFKIRSASSIGDLVKNVDILVLAIKPQDFRLTGAEIRRSLTPRHCIITILAGVPVARIKKELGSKVEVVRAMPNLGATVGQAVTALTGSIKSRLNLAGKIFAGCGEVLYLPEKLFDAVTALSGSGPAYFFYLIELLVKEAMRHGFSEREANLLVKQTAKGAALLAWQSKDSAAELRQKVTSKGGTTEAALQIFEKKNFPLILREAITNAIKRAKDLGRR